MSDPGVKSFRLMTFSKKPTGRREWDGTHVKAALNKSENVNKHRGRAERVRVQGSFCVVLALLPWRVHFGVNKQLTDI